MAVSVSRGTLCAAKCILGGVRGTSVWSELEEDDPKRKQAMRISRVLQRPGLPHPRIGLIYSPFQQSTELYF